MTSTSWGPGWYGLECWPPKVRWMGKRASAWLRGGDASNVHIRAHTVPEGIRLRVAANGREIGSVPLEPSRWMDVSLPLDRKVFGSPQAGPGGQQHLGSRRGPGKWGRTGSLEWQWRGSGRIDAGIPARYVRTFNSQERRGRTWMDEPETGMSTMLQGRGALRL